MLFEGITIAEGDRIVLFGIIVFLLFCVIHKDTTTNLRTIQSFYGLSPVVLLERYYVLLVLGVVLLLLMWIVAEQGLLVIAYLSGCRMLMLLLVLIWVHLLGYSVRVLFPGHTVLRALARTLASTLTRTRAGAALLTRTIALRCWGLRLWHRIHRNRCIDIVVSPW